MSTVKFNKNPNCTYNCTDGRIYMPALNNFVACPDCTKANAMIEGKPEGTTVHDVLRIPEQYQTFSSPTGDIFNLEDLKAFRRESVDSVIFTMDKINKGIYNGKVYKQSIYLVTTKLVDVYLFVYGSMLLGVEKGFSVSPFISLNTLNGLQRVGDFPFTELRELTEKNPKNGLRNVHPEMLNAIDGYRTIQDTGLTYYDYINSDVCFVEATANTTENGWRALADLMTERARIGKPTYVIGYWTHRSTQAGVGLRYLINKNDRATLDRMKPVEISTGKTYNNNNNNNNNNQGYNQRQDFGKPKEDNVQSSSNLGLSDL